MVTSQEVIGIIGEMDMDQCFHYIEECQAKDILLSRMHYVVKMLVDTLIYCDEYPNGYSDFIKEVKAHDFTMKHKKKGE